MALVLSACGDLNRPIDINLPDFESEVVVECYLQPGQPYILSLTESVSYFEAARLLYIKDATVEITHGNEKIALQPVSLPLPEIDQLEILRPLVGDSLFFYTAFATVPEDYESEFFLDVTTAD